MEALLQTYASSDSESDSEREGASPKAKKGRFTPEKGSLPLPPPPSDLLNPSNSVCLSNADPHMGRTRSFPHVEGNFALHVYIPVPLSSIAKRQMEPLMKKASFLDPDLQSIEVEFPAPRNGNENSLNELKLAKEYHISLSRTVPIRIHQIETILRMLKHKFSSQKRFWMEFGRWDFFVNDDRTRSFLALEIPPSKGSSEIQRPIQIVNEVFRLHNLPTFYENPRLHISVAWLLGDASSRLKAVAEELNTQAESNNSAAIWSFLFSSIDCKIGKQIYPIWRAT